MSLRSGLGAWGLSGRVYYYLRTTAGKSVGGPYTTIAQLKRAVSRRPAHHALVAQRFVDGTWHDLTEAEYEALLA